ncbi:hypothetical protein MYX65_01440 [Acidobacteria bacterium AH-259-L09]|nr:hypothetical protein [Acidobacteria bacterium AH-259-L09]
MKVPAGTHVLIGLAIGVVVVAVVSGLIVLGPPSEERARRLDDRRVADLRGITRAVDLYWTRRGRLPSSLDDLWQESRVNISSRDPGTAQVYDFRVLGAETYELCAHFQRNSAGPAQGLSRGFWSHGVGRQCFQLEAQKVPR